MLSGALAISAAMMLFACKQSAQVNPVEGGPATQETSFNLSVPRDTTGAISIVPVRHPIASKFSELAVIECNSSVLAEANQAIASLEKAGAIIAEDGRRLSSLSLDNDLKADCHLLHPLARIDAKSLTLINERVLKWSGFRQPTRSDLAVYEVAQIAWIGMNSAIRWNLDSLGAELFSGQASGDGAQEEMLRRTVTDRLTEFRNTYDPCAPSTAGAPRWVVDDPMIRQRQYICEDSGISLRIDAKRTYSAVRHALRSGIVALFQDSRGMRPIPNSTRLDNHFAFSPLVHGLNN